ncbi:adaptin N terminal region-domain-containing protein [Hysterangium stoloniferum]|nr:adaptin N terminal region-domain-containing protein [Hysterangium stoloniferum]
MSLNALQENASRLGMRIQESFSEHTRDLNIGKYSSATFFDTAEDKVKNIRKQLDSSQDRDKLEGMKRLIAMISKGRDVSEFFAQVVKNVASHNLEIRKLVYIYLLRYAEHEPDLALLSINTFQKDLTDSNPLIRAMALRVLSGIKVPMVGSIVALGIKKCAADPSPYVRKAAALAIPKLYSLDPSHLTVLEPVLLGLLRDRSPVSIGCVAEAFSAVCPQRLDLLHPHYRRLCRVLVDVDEWGQVSLMNLLLRYARQMLPKPQMLEDCNGKEDIDPDIRLLLSSAEPLFQSRNPAVVLSVCRTHYSLSGPQYLPRIISSLLRLTHAAPSSEVERVVLFYLVFIAQEAPTLLAPYHTRFYIRSRDLPQTKHAKMKILSLLIASENVQSLIREFTEYASDIDDKLVADSIHAIGQCAHMAPESTQQCLTALKTFIQSDHDVVVSNGVLVLKSLVQFQLSNRSAAALPSPSKAPFHIIEHLAYKVDEVRHPRARACILWLVGQYAGRSDTSVNPVLSVEGVVDWAPDVLRKMAKCFPQESSIVKLQTVTLAAKLLVLNPTHNTLGLLSRYVFSLAKFDLDYDVRDRSRVLHTLLTGIAPALRAVANGEEYLEEQGGVVLRREQVKAILFDGKMGPLEDESTIVEQDFLGSSSVILGKELPGDRHLPDWIEQGVDPTLRDTEEDNAPPLPAHTPRAIQNIAVPSRGGSPVILTPGGIASPAGSFVQRDKFYNDEEDEEEETDDDDDEEESDNDNEGNQTTQGVGGQESASHTDSSTADSEGEDEDDDVEDNDGSFYDSHSRQLHTILQ